jgi:hypothetical protein
MNERLKSSTKCVIYKIKILARFLHKADTMPMFWNCAELCWHGNCIKADAMPSIALYVVYMIARQHQTLARLLDSIFY